jgi:hypothetical protein
VSTKTLEKVSVIPSDEPQALVPVTPMDMLNRAVTSGASLEMVEKLMTLQERWEAGQARKAFDRAVSAAKKEIPPITRNAKGHNSKKYADFAAIAAVVDPIIGRHGLSYRFRTTQNGSIAVTCVLSHEDGHSEETTLSGPADGSGSKNAIQAIGSTLTYLQRYSLVQMLGLAASNDDDGKASDAGSGITLEQVEELVALADEVGADKEAFCRYFKVDGFANITTKDYPRAIAALNKKRAAK